MAASGETAPEDEDEHIFPMNWKKVPHRIIRSSKAGKNVFFVDFAHETEGKLDKVTGNEKKAQVYKQFSQ